MTTSSAKFSRQIRDIPDFLIFWSDLYEAQQRFVYVSHGYPEDSHKTTATTLDGIKQLLLNDFETWHRKTIPRSALFRSRVRPAYLTFMQSMPLIQKLYQRCPNLSHLEMRMLCSQLEVQTDIFFCGKHELALLTLVEQQTWLASFLLIEDIREAIKNNSRTNIIRSNNPDNCCSGKLSWIQQNCTDKQEYHPSGSFNPVRELASSSKLTNHQFLTSQTTKLSEIVHETSSKITNKSSINLFVASNKQENYPAENYLIGELALHPESNPQMATNVEPKITPDNRIMTSRYTNKTSSRSILTVNTEIETLKPTIMQVYHPTKMILVRELAIRHPKSNLQNSTIDEHETSIKSIMTSSQLNVSSHILNRSSESSKRSDNKMRETKTSRTVYSLTPRREHKIRKWNQLQFSILSHRKCNRTDIANVRSMNRHQHSSSSSTKSADQQQHSINPASSVEIDEISQLFHKLTLGDDPEKLKEKIDKIHRKLPQEIMSSSSNIDDSANIISSLRNRKQHKAQKYFESSNPPIIVKRIMAHRRLICQTIRGRQKGRKKKLFSQFSSSLTVLT
ncbi:hypothetical protein ACKWTF_007623 [Chironomus riparius]